MKLAHPLFDKPVAIDENKIPVLVIENPSFFSQICFDIHDQCNGNEGRLVLSENQRIFPFSKTVEMIVDYTGIEINNHKILKGIYENINTMAHNEDWYMKTQELKSSINRYFGEIFGEYNFQLMYNHEMDFCKLLKAVDCKLNYEQPTLAEKLIEYCYTVREFCGIRLFFLINLKSYLTEREILDIYEYVIYNKIDLVLIENCDGQRLSEVEETTVIDQDLCEF